MSLEYAGYVPEQKGLEPLQEDGGPAGLCKYYERNWVHNISNRVERLCKKLFDALHFIRDLFNGFPSLKICQ